MSSVELIEPCLVALVQGDADASELHASLAHLRAVTDPGCRIEVFANEQAPADSLPRTRWHPAAPGVPGVPGAIGVAGVAIALLDESPSADLAIVTAGTRLAPHWRHRLQAGLHRDPALATTSPPGIAGRPHPACVMLRAGARAAVAAADRGDWASALLREGWLHGAATGVLARRHKPGAATPAVSNEPGAATPALVHKPGAATPARGRPVQLHIAHSWGGGLGRWVADFRAADRERENLVLRSVGVRGAYGQRLTLQRNYEDLEPLRVWDLAEPIAHTAIRHQQYRAILREIVADFGVQAVLVSSLIGHSLDALATGLPTTVVTHDYYPLCVTIFAHFDGVCGHCDAARLARCIATNPMHGYFPAADVDDFEALRRSFAREVLARDVLLVSPSSAAAEQWRALMPPLADARREILPHGVALPPRVDFSPPGEGRLRVVVLNRLAPEKGGRILAAMLPELARFADVALLGCGHEGDEFAGLPGVRTVRQYSREALPGLVAEAKPHLGLQLSVFPETYCYALTELWQLGVPVLACRSGSLAERITEGVDGFLCAADPAELLARIRELDARRDQLASMRATLLGRDVRPATDMVADYHRLIPVDPCFAAAPGFATGDDDDDSGRPMRVRLGVITVSAHATYAAALRAFARYTLVKLRHSPRLPLGIRRLLDRLPQHWYEGDSRV